MYHNFDSMYARLVTGSFNVEEDKELGYVISGDYDYENGDWTREYVVSDRLEDAMTWTAKDDAGDVHRFVRCEKVPDEIRGRSEIRYGGRRCKVIRHFLTMLPTPWGGESPGVGSF